MSQKIRIFLCDSVVEIEAQIIRTLRRIVHIGEAGTTLCTITFQAELPKGPRREIRRRGYPDAFGLLDYGWIWTRPGSGFGVGAPGRQRDGRIDLARSLLTKRPVLIEPETK